MCLLDICGGWNSLVASMELYAGEETTRRILYEAGLAETFSKFSLTRGIIENTEKGFRDALDTYSDAGFGDFQIKELQFGSGYARITCRDTFEAWAFLRNRSPNDYPVCHYSTGVLLSFMKTTSGMQDLFAVETKCLAKGDKKCEFMIGKRRTLEKKGVQIHQWGLSIKEKSERLTQLLEEKGRIEKKLIRRNLELSIVNRISATLNQTLDLDRLLTLAVEELSKIVGNKGIGIYLVDRKNNELVFCAQKGFSDEFFKGVSRLKMSQGVAGETARLQAAIVYDDYSKHPRKLDIAIKKEKIKSLLSVPLTAQNNIVGVLNIASRVPHHFTEEEVSLMTLIGNQIGTAVANAILHEEMRESEQRYKSLVGNINDGYLLCQRGKVVFANKAFLEIYGFNYSDVIGKDLYNFLSEECAKQVERFFKGWPNNNNLPEYIEFLRTHKSGRKLPTELKINVMELGGMPSLVGIFRDLSEKKRMEQKVLENERLASLGQLAADIAHEIRNPLSAIKMNVQILSKELNLEGFAEKRLKIVQGEIVRLDKILEEILDAAKPIQIEIKPCNVTEIIEECLNLIEDKLKEKRIVIDLQTSHKPRLIQGDAMKLRQAFLNVIINAIEAMPDGGKILIVLKPARRAGRKMLKVEIHDTGYGIDSAHLPKIFTPFFSTKDRGIGLGLSNVKNIVEAHGGIVEIKSKVGLGTCFRILIPTNP